MPTPPRSKNPLFSREGGIIRHRKKANLFEKKTIWRKKKLFFIPKKHFAIPKNWLNSAVKKNEDIFLRKNFFRKYFWKKIKNHVFFYTKINLCCPQKETKFSSKNKKTRKLFVRKKQFGKKNVFFMQQKLFVVPQKWLNSAVKKRGLFLFFFKKHFFENFFGKKNWKKKCFLKKFSNY